MNYLCPGNKTNLQEIRMSISIIFSISVSAIIEAIGIPFPALKQLFFYLLFILMSVKPHCINCKIIFYKIISSWLEKEVFNDNFNVQRYYLILIHL